MTAPLDLPPELVLHTASLLTREIILDPKNRLAGFKARQLELVPDLPSINALSQTNRALHCTLTQILYDYCASVETLGKLALLFAVEHQLENTLDKLVAAGISLDGRFFFECDNRSEYGTLLHIAAAMGHGAMVAKLLELFGAEKNTRAHTRHGSDSTTALDYAARYEHMDIVGILAPIPIPNSSPPPSDSTERRKRYLSLALLESIKVGNRDISAYLVSEGANVSFVNQRRSSGLTPLYYAADTNNLELVKLLLASGADPNLPITYGFTPVFSAASNNNMAIVQALLDAGADMHVKDHDLFTVLELCTDVKLLRFFLERGVDPNAQDRNKMTALHRACAAAEMNAEFVKASVELLLQFGAGPVDRPSYTVEGTAVDFAMHNGYSEVVKILEPLVEDPKLLERIAGWWEKRKREEERGDA